MDRGDSVQAVTSALFSYDKFYYKSVHLLITKLPLRNIFHSNFDIMYKYKYKTKNYTHMSWKSTYLSWNNIVFYSDMY